MEGGGSCLIEKKNENIMRSERSPVESLVYIGYPIFFYFDNIKKIFYFLPSEISSISINNKATRLMKEQTLVQVL